LRTYAHLLKVFLRAYAHYQLCSLARFDLANRGVCYSRVAHFRCSTARIRQDNSAASFRSCKLLRRRDECVLLPCFAARYFCSYGLLCRSFEFIFLRYPDLERW